MNVLDLFSGIGGFSLGLERAGMRTVAFCEIEPFCRRVLAKHWPGVPVYDDVRTLTAERIRADGISVDVICGGFPCQDISVAGKGLGIDGVRSGLWSEYARVVGELRPLVVVVENVAALLGRGLDRVLGDLAALGYDAEWHCIPASAVGAPHRRDRIWIVAYSAVVLGDGRNDHRGRNSQGAGKIPKPRDGSRHENLADADEPRLEGWLRAGLQECAREWAFGSRGSPTSHTDSKSPIRATEPWGECGHWFAEPDVGRVAHGVPARVDRLKSLGNSVVPQIPEIIGRAIMSAKLTSQQRAGEKS